MRYTLSIVAAAAVMTTSPTYAEDATGHWTGSIGNALPVIVQFAKPTDGPWEGTLSVPTQGVVSKVEKLVVTPGQVSFALPRFNASYAATWDGPQQAWTGTWTQG